MVISIASCVNSDMRKQIVLSDKIREETLTRCCSIIGYKDLALQDKNRIYDKVKREVEKELKEGNQK